MEGLTLEFRYHPTHRDVVTRALIATTAVVMDVMREIWPTFRVPMLGTCVTRFDDVQDILLRPDDFHVPYQDKVDHLDWNPTFLLAMSPGADYDATLAFVRELWRADDVDWISELCARTAESALSGQTRVDAMQDVVYEAVLNVIREYYGIPIPAEFKEEYLSRSFTLAGFLFGFPADNKKENKLAAKAISGLWQWLDDAIANPAPSPPGRETVLQRGLVRADGDPEALAMLRSALMGMTLGFTPAGSNAFGRSLLVLLRNPQVRALAIERARRDLTDPEHRAAFHRVFVEGVRLNYILPGIWRRAVTDARIGPPGAERTVAKDGVLFLAMPAAMKDRRRQRQPRRFNADRSLDGYMIYGFDFHFCVGAYIADNLAIETLGALFRRGAKADGRVAYHGLMPWRVPVMLERGP